VVAVEVQHLLLALLDLLVALEVVVGTPKLVAQEHPVKEIRVVLEGQQQPPLLMAALVAAVLVL
jgi:hypothetical protein